MRLPFSSLRTNLIAGFVATIAVSLVLASGVFAYLVRDYQVERERDRLEGVAFAYTLAVSRWARQGNPMPTIAGLLDQSAADNNARVLILDDRGLVLHDTEDNLFRGRTFGMPPGRRPGVNQGVMSTPSGDEVFTIVTPPFVSESRGILGSLGLRVAVIAPEQSLSNAWQDVLPRLSIAALLALLVSIGIAWWLASAITKPLVQITRASEEMARGNLDPHLTLPDTADEVGRLSKAFTVMAREVARSHRAMRDLLTNVSHDLRTPLTSISGFAGALVDGTVAGAEGAREAGRIIGEEAERMRRLIEDLLYLGHIDTGDLSLQQHPVDLAEVARATQARFQFRAQESGIAFDVRAPEPARILGDPHRLAQVLDNLLENAFKFTPPTGRVDVSVALDPGTSNGPIRRPAMASLSVHNTGSYIAPEEAERVFERFYQIDKARAGQRGSGLGLAIAREIVQAHRGHIELRSSPQTGTSFTVRIPAHNAGPPLPLISSEPAAAEVGSARR